MTALKEAILAARQCGNEVERRMSEIYGVIETASREGVSFPQTVDSLEKSLELLLAIAVTDISTTNPGGLEGEVEQDEDPVENAHRLIEIVIPSLDACLSKLDRCRQLIKAVEEQLLVNGRRQHG